MNKNCLSYWFPILERAGLPVPKTEIVRTKINLYKLLDGDIPEGWGGFLADMNLAIEKVGGQPCFLRTGQGSGKHQWAKTCFLDLKNGTLPNHIAALVEWSELVDMIGLPADVWVVRELLPTEPICVLPGYQNMPLVPEARCFVEGGKVRCWHPYWPEKSIKEGFPFKSGKVWEDDLDYELPDNFAAIVTACHELDTTQFMPLADRVAEVFAGNGAWSVDLLPTKRGWFVTDMAEASQSFHWEGCPIEFTKVAK